MGYPGFLFIALDFRFFFAYDFRAWKRTTWSRSLPMADAPGPPLVPKFAEPVRLARGRGEATRPDESGCLAPTTPKPWTVPSRGLAVFHGSGDVARLSHYFLPRLLLQGKRVLYLDGANSADPRLLARLARERGVAFEQFSRQIEIARAFTCFQLTELIARLPRLLADFPAQVLVVTALPDLYYDEDVRDWDARVAFEQALANLRQWAVAAVSERQALTPSPSPADGGRGWPVGPGEGNERRYRGPLTVAVFSAAASFAPPPARRRFFDQVSAAATEVWKFSLGEGSRLELACTRAQTPQGRKPPGRHRGLPLHAAMES